MTIYKGFDLNDEDTPDPWAPREVSKDQDQIDTMVGDAIVVGKDVAGHKHSRIYSPLGVTGVEVDSSGDVQIVPLTVAGLVTNTAGGILGTVPVLPINLGGTNSVAPLNNGRVMVSNGGAIVESPVLEAEVALLSGMTGIVDGVAPSTDIVTKSYVDEVATGGGTFIAMTDTPVAYTTDRILFEGAAAVEDSDSFTWDDVNKVLQIQNSKVDSSGSSLKFRKSRAGGDIANGDENGHIVWESHEGGSWVEQGSITVDDYSAPASPHMNLSVGGTAFLRAYDSVQVYPSTNEMVVKPAQGGTGFRTINPLQVAVQDISSTYYGIQVHANTKFGIASIVGTGVGANGAHEGSQAANLVLQMLNTPGGGNTIIAAEMSYGGNLLEFRGVGSSYARAAVPALAIDLEDNAISLGGYGSKIDEFSNDGTLADESTTALPTEYAVKTYVDTEISDIDGTWTNYSSTSTVTGWDTPDVTIWYKQVGKTVFVRYSIFGISDQTYARFTLPVACNSLSYSEAAFGKDDNVNITTGCKSVINYTSNTTVDLFPDQSYDNTGLWTNSGVKRVNGQLWYVTS